LQKQSLLKRACPACTAASCLCLVLCGCVSRPRCVARSIWARMRVLREAAGRACAPTACAHEPVCASLAPATERTLGEACCEEGSPVYIMCMLLYIPRTCCVTHILLFKVCVTQHIPLTTAAVLCMLPSDRRRSPAAAPPPAPASLCPAAALWLSGAATATGRPHGRAHSLPALSLGYVRTDSAAARRSTGPWQGAGAVRAGQRAARRRIKLEVAVRGARARTGRGVLTRCRTDAHATSPLLQKQGAMRQQVADVDARVRRRTRRRTRRAARWWRRRPRAAAAAAA